MAKKLTIIVAWLFVVGCQNSNDENIRARKPDNKQDMCTADAEVLKRESQMLSRVAVAEHDAREGEATGESQFITPTIRLSEEEWPTIADDLEFSGMELAIRRQLKRFKSWDLNKTIRLGADEYRLEQAKLSLEKFNVLLLEYGACVKNKKLNCREMFSADMQKYFHAYVPKLERGDPRFDEKKPVLFTAYYTPEIFAQTQRTDEFKYAIYARPQDPNQTGSPRVEIDFRNALDNSNLELFYTNDLFGLYLLHIEGGGHVKVKDSKRGDSSSYISYDGTNAKPWNFISKYMREQNMIADSSTAAQRRYLEGHPERQEEIYETCPSYVYFKKTVEPPFGSDSVPLTDNRSIATDRNYYKFKGLLAYVETERPTENRRSNPSCQSRGFRPYSRFYLDQDTGGAIRGKARVDLYFGEGEYAEQAAHNVVRRGDLYFFMLK